MVPNSEVGRAHDPPDAVDVILDQWARERPDLDVSPMGVIGRLHRVAALLDDRLRVVFDEAGLGAGDFDVLATLRRAGEPFLLSPSELAHSTMVTSGAVTKRVDRLVEAGLVTRIPRIDDARGRHIALTAEGVQVVDRLVELHVANEHRLLGVLDPVSKEALANLLSVLLVDLES